jgi:hypothetical protein
VFLAQAQKWPVFNCARLRSLPSSLININSINQLIDLRFKMDDKILSSPNIPKEGDEWQSPARAVIRAMQRLGFSQREIQEKTTCPRRT